MDNSVNSIPTHGVSRRRLYQQIADDIERLILEGTFPAGTRLPSEQEFAERYGVSRNVVREALKSLKELGLVSIRTGSGTYVRRPSMEQVTEALNRFVRHSLNDFSFNHFYEIRRMIEPENARLAAQRASPEDLNAILAPLQDMEQKQDDLKIWSSADLKFHLAIASATQNPLLVNLLIALIEPLRTVIAAGYAEPLGPAAGLEAHRKIAKAIQDRLGQEAYDGMLEHLIDSEQRLVKAGTGLNQKEVERQT
jgi:GntR family transcriptional repressor for pyruvate dehydrogenase complex